MVYVVQQRHEVNTSTCATRTPVPVRYLLVPDSLPTVFTFLEALSRWWTWYKDTMTLGVVVLVVSVAPGVPRSPTRRVQQHEQCVRFPHTYSYI